MKKTIITVSITLFCAALGVFLLLPFLQTQPSATAQLGQQAKATPQIFTANPLTDIVNRIARFFGGSKKATPQPGVLSEEEAEEQFGVPQGEFIADARAAAENPISSTEGEAAPAPNGVYSQTEEGEWVLVRQISPETAVAGMHEISAKSNAYETYVQQERLARFNPATAIHQTEDLPDSKWARMWTPVKRFLGFEKPKPANGPAAWQETGDPMVLASSDGLGGNKEKNARNFYRAQDSFSFKPFKLNTGSSAGSSENGTWSLFDMISPTAALRENAKWLADQFFPNPQTEEEKKRHQDVQKGHENKYEKQVKENINRLLATSLGKDDTSGTDPVVGIMNCSSTPTDVQKSLCEIARVSDFEQNQAVDDLGVSWNPGNDRLRLQPDLQPDPKEIEQIRQDMAARFQQGTNLPWPEDSPRVSLVFGKVDPTQITEMRQSPTGKSPAWENAVKIYDYMAQNCEGDCYWLATDAAQNIDSALRASGLKLEEDPGKLYEHYSQGFIQEQLEKQEEAGGTITQEDLEKQLRENKPAYVPYPVEKIQQYYANAKRAQKERKATSPGDVSIPLMVNPGVAISYQKSTDSNEMVFFDPSNGLNQGDTRKRAEGLTDGMIQYINAIQAVKEESKKDASTQALTNQVNGIQQKVSKELKQGIQDFNQTGEMPPPSLK